MDNSCSIYIKFGSTKIKIPVNPGKIEIQHPTDHKTYDVIGAGEIVVPRKPSLRVVSWESIFPGDTDAPYVNSAAHAPRYYANFFEKAWKKKQVGRLVISRDGMYDTNMRCIISDFKTNDQGGEPDDMYYSIEFTEYRSYAPEIISVITVQQESGAAGAVAEASAETQREVETPIMRVGASVIANGEYCYDSYGAKPHGTANNLTATVRRIVSGNPYPVLIGDYGWIQESQLQITG